MDYNEAQQVLVEVFHVIENSDANVFSLRDTQNGLYGTGYSVIVKAFVSSIRKQELYEIAKKHSLRVVERQEGFTIYKPK
jgi:hypothetical protein